MSDTDTDPTWRAARYLVSQYGDQAPALCRERAEAQKDTGGEMAWNKIAEAAETLLKNGASFDLPRAL